MHEAGRWWRSPSAYGAPYGGSRGRVAHEALRRKSTTLRILLGLAAPTAGTATIDGRRYRDLVAAAGVALHELRPAARTLEDAFLELTGAGREAAR